MQRVKTDSTVGLHQHMLSGLPFHSGAVMFSGFRIALVQMFVVNHRPTNLHRAEKLITQATKNGAKVVAMPVSKAGVMDSYDSCPIILTAE